MLKGAKTFGIDEDKNGTIMKIKPGFSLVVNNKQQNKQVIS